MMIFWLTCLVGYPRTSAPEPIYIFDDVVTTGASYALFANQLETFGGNVLGGLFLGRTHYKYNK